jgi:hypothetical protein
VKFQHFSLATSLSISVISGGMLLLWFLRTAPKWGGGPTGGAADVFVYSTQGERHRVDPPAAHASRGDGKDGVLDEVGGGMSSEYDQSALGNDAAYASSQQHPGQESKSDGAHGVSS